MKIAEAVDAASNMNQLRCPVTSVKQRVRPFQKTDARFFIVFQSFGFLVHALNSCFQSGSVGRSAVRYARGATHQFDGIEHFSQSHRFKIDELWQTWWSSKDSIDFLFRDRAHITQRLGYDQLGSEPLHKFFVERIKRLICLQVFAYGSVNLSGV